MRNFSVNFTVRTDLASEIREHWKQNNGCEIPGTEYFSDTFDGFCVDTLLVNDKNGEQNTGKPIGKYVTVQTGQTQSLDSVASEKLMHLLSKTLRSFLPDEDGTCLLVCLGNSNITADAIGPLCAQNFIVTNHIYENDKDLFASLCLRRTCCICPGVAGKTGIETASLVKIAVEQISPSFVIAIDALASRHLSRLATTIQICSTGISPGSGVGNNRRELSQKTLGVPVIAIGIPTVVDARTLCYNILSSAYDKNQISLPNDTEQMIFSSCDGFFVSPKETDSIVRACAKLVGYSVNMALHENLTKAEIDELIS